MTNHDVLLTCVILVNSSRVKKSPSKEVLFSGDQRYKMKCMSRTTQVCLSMLYFVKNLSNYYQFGLSRCVSGMIFKNPGSVIFWIAWFSSFNPYWQIPGKFLRPFYRDELSIKKSWVLIQFFEKPGRELVLLENSSRPNVTYHKWF